MENFSANFIKRKGMVFLMTYEIMNTILVERLPEVKDAVRKETSHWKYEEVPSHVLYEVALNQSGFMYGLLLEDSNKSLIEKVFVFFEEMASCDDREVRNLLQVSILEYLWGDFQVLSRAHKYMHPKTRILSDELQIYFKPFKPT